MSRTFIRCLEQTGQWGVEGVKRKVTTQGDARPMSLVRHHGRRGKDCREVEGLLHTDKDPRPYFQLNPHQHINLKLRPHPHPTRQQGHSHKLHGHSHQLHGHKTQVSGTLQTSSTQLEELLGFLQANQHHIPLQKHGTVEYHHHRYCSVRFDFLFIKLWYW